MRLDRLDQAALAFVIVLLVIIGVILLRGDQVGVQIIRTSPVDNAGNVATRAQLAFTFSEPMPSASIAGRIQITPALSGTLRWNGSTAFFVPVRPLAHDTLYTITVAAGGRSERGRALLHDVTWSFRTGHPRVVALTPATSTGDLFVYDISGNTQPQRITSEPYGVFDFAVSPDGAHIVYSASRDTTGARDLWLINPDGSSRERIVTCDEQVCQTPSWSADGTRIAFERRNLVQGALGKSPGPSRIWVYDLGSKSLASLLSDSQQLGILPRWAPVGTRLAYYDPIASNIMVLDVSSGESARLSSVLGDSGTWSPDGIQLIYPELHATDAGQFSQLLRADLVSNVITPVMPLSASNDTSVVWSPIGSLIAFSRQRTSANDAGGVLAPFGPQVWVSTPDGHGARALTSEPEYSFGGLEWSPDGDWIVAVRNDLQTPNPKPDVWLVRSDGSQHVRLASDATIPAWLP